MKRSLPLWLVATEIWSVFGLSAHADPQGGGPGGAPGPAANTSYQMGCVYSPTTPVPTSVLNQLGIRCDNNGNLMVTVNAGASVGPNNSTAPTSSTQIGGQDASGNLQPAQMDAAKHLIVGAGPYLATALVGGDQVGLGTSSATALTVPSGALFCVVTAVVASVNWRADGTNPVAGSGGGQPLGVGQQLVVNGPVLMGTIKFINQTGASGALINISYFK